MNVTRLDENKYKILIDEVYTNYVDPLCFFEFYPGDIVESGPQTFSDGNKVQVAEKLISEGQWPDRKLSEFKFKAMLGQLNIEDRTAYKYSDEIERLKKEIDTGQFFYPVLIEVVVKLHSLMINEK